MPMRAPRLLSMVCGLHFAVLQFAYFFLLEAWLSSQSLTYFIALLFWLTGFVFGLRLRGERWFLHLLLLGVSSYYLAWSLTRVLPFHTLLYPAVAVCAIASGLLPGYFFTFITAHMQPIRRPLLHENNGFMLGLMLALYASIHCGNLFLGWAPAAGALLTGLCLTAATARAPAV